MPRDFNQDQTFEPSYALCSQDLVKRLGKKAPNCAWRVLMCLQAFSMNGEYCFPSHEKIQSWLGGSESIGLSTIRKALLILERAEIIKRNKRTSRKRYQMLLNVQEVTPEPPKPVKQSIPKPEPKRIPQQQPPKQRTSKAGRATAEERQRKRWARQEEAQAVRRAEQAVIDAEYSKKLDEQIKQYEQKQLDKEIEEMNNEPNEPKEPAAEPEIQEEEDDIFSGLSPEHAEKLRRIHARNAPAKARRAREAKELEARIERQKKKNGLDMTAAIARLKEGLTPDQRRASMKGKK